MALGTNSTRTIQKVMEIGFLSIFLAVVLRTFLIAGYTVPSGSMENSLQGGDILFTNKRAFKNRSPRPGELVVFKYPLNPRKRFVKRCIAVSGQTVEIDDKTLYLDGRLTSNPGYIKFSDHHILDMTYSNRDNFGPYEVPPNSIFVMGDNRDLSIDSRFWGAVPLNMIEGKPLFVYFSWREDKNVPEGRGIVEAFQKIFYNIIHFFGRLNISRLGKPAR